MNYKNYRRLFESVKRKSKFFFYLWKIMKEVIGKARKTQPFFRAKFLLKVHECRYENLPIPSSFYKK